MYSQNQLNFGIIIDNSDLPRVYKLMTLSKNVNRFNDIYLIRNGFLLSFLNLLKTKLF